MLWALEREKRVHLIESQQPKLVWEEGILPPEDAKLAQEIRSPGVGTMGWRRRMRIKNCCRTLLPKSEGLWGNLLSVHKDLKAGCKEGRARPLWWCPGTGHPPTYSLCGCVNVKVLLVFLHLWFPTILLVLIPNSQTNSQTNTAQGFHGQPSILSGPFFL